MNLQLFAPPAAAPITVAEAKSHIRLASGITVDDADVGRYIDAAVGLLEGHTNRAFVARTYDLVLDEPKAGGVIELLRAPIVSVSGVFTTDEDDVETEVDDTVYRVSLGSGRIALRRGESWPYASTLRELDAYRIRYVAGHGDADDWTADDVDADPAKAAIRQAIAVQVAEWYENRGDDPEMGVGATATQGVQLALGESAKGILRAAGLIRYVL